nr:MAG TPA: YopX protein [Caudoviricetes sp.]
MIFLIRNSHFDLYYLYSNTNWQLDYSYVWGKEMHTDACNLGFYVCERNCVEVIGNIFDNPELLEGERC